MNILTELTTAAQAGAPLTRAHIVRALDSLLDDATPRIVGQAWICNGPRQDEWEFTLFLPHAVGSRDEMDWASLLPAENLTKWLVLDQSGKRIQIEPLAAVPDGG